MATEKTITEKIAEYGHFPYIPHRPLMKEDVVWLYENTTPDFFEAHKTIIQERLSDGDGGKVDTIIAKSEAVQPSVPEAAPTAPETDTLTVVAVAPEPSSAVPDEPAPTSPKSKSK